MNLLSKIWRILPFPLRLRIVRSTQKKFTVSVVAIVTNRRDEVLILDHFIRPGASWGLPGGFIKTNEQPDTAIARELAEETGLTLTNVRLSNIRTIRKHIEIHYLANADGNVEIKASEIRDFGWYPPDQLPAGLSDSQRQTIQNTLGEFNR